MSKVIASISIGKKALMELELRPGASERVGSSLAAAGGLKGMSPVWEYERKQELDPLSLPGLPRKLLFPFCGVSVKFGKRRN